MRNRNQSGREIAIGALSRRTGVQVETIRYYERVRLLAKPARSAGGYRLYTAEDVGRLRFVRRARALGFTLEEVRALLRLADQAKDACADARDLAAAHPGGVRAKIADLRAMESVLEKTVAQCDAGNRSTCPLIEVLSSSAPASFP